MPIWLTVLLFAVFALWLGRCFLALLEQRRCRGFCIVPLVAVVLVFSDLLDMGVRLYDLFPLAIQSIDLPQGFAGTALMAAIIFTVVLGGLHLLAGLFDRWRRARRRRMPPDAGGPLVMPAEDEGQALGDWQRLLRQADRRLGESDGGLDVEGADAD